MAEETPVPQPTQARADHIKEQAHTGDTSPVVPPRNVDVPYVGGDATVGGTLTCTMGNWQGMDTGTYAWQWNSGGSNVAGAGDSYVVGAGDAGQSITCIVTATNDAGSTEAPPSNAVAIPAASTESTQSRRK